MSEKSPEDVVHEARLLELTEVEMAVARGIRRAVSDPALWEAAGTAMRAQAQSTAGGWLLGGLASVFQRVAWVVVIMAGVYLLGGWAALVAFVKSHGATA